MNDNEKYMLIAIKEAEKARRKDEVPVGAVIVRDNKVITKAHNMRERRKDPSAHAELLAIKKAAKKLGGWRLSGCILYVTLEPCPMCAGSVINSRIDEVVFGAYDPKAGAFGSVCNLANGKFNHTPKIEGGVLKEQCAKILTDYFRKKR